MSTRFVLGSAGRSTTRSAGTRRCSSSSSRELRHPAGGADPPTPGRLASATCVRYPARLRPRRCRGRAVRRLLRHRRGVRRAVRHGGSPWAARACGRRSRWTARRAEHAAPGQHRRQRPPAAAARASTTSRSADAGHARPAPDRAVPDGRAGPRWATSTSCAPHPNRLIYVNDPPNRELRIAAELGDALRTADVFLLSGFNAMQDPATLESAPGARCAKHMRRCPPDALVVLRGRRATTCPR